MQWVEALLKDPVGASLVDTNLRAVGFIISPKEFHRADIAPKLAWQSVKFAPTAKKSVPEEPGLYAFVVRVPYDGLPLHGWVMYIGQTGDSSSGATLRGRFGQYLRDKKVPKRPPIFYMLNAWDGCLDFYYTPLPNRKAELVKLETQLLGAFRPPFTDRTYPASYMSPRHAF
jgi:hypothetical protein